MIEIPLSQSGPPNAFAKAVLAHCADLQAHRVGKPGRPAPRASDMIERLIGSVPDIGPVDKRGPDKFVVLPYKVVDDTPRTPEAEQAISVLRETLNQGA